MLEPAPTGPPPAPSHPSTLEPEPAPAALGLIIEVSLGLDMAAVSVDRASFEQQFVADITHLLHAPLSSVAIVDIRQGSVVVTCEFFSLDQARIVSTLQAANVAIAGGTVQGLHVGVSEPEPEPDQFAACEGLRAPAHGQLGTCGSHLEHGSTCNFECDSGYTLSGSQPECTDGRLSESVDCAMDVSCAGSWSSCGSDCSRTFAIAVQAEGSGSVCATGNGASETCTPGEGLCPAAPEPEPEPEPCDARESSSADTIRLQLSLLDQVINPVQPRNVAVTAMGHAAITEYGARFDGDGDLITISNVEYATDASFTLAFWMTKEDCTGGFYEYLYSHATNRLCDIFDPLCSNVNVYVACQAAGGGFSTFGATSVLRYNLLGTQSWTDGQRGSATQATFDYPLQATGNFDSITSEWIDVMLTVTPNSVQTYDDGSLVADSEYGFYTGSMGADNAAYPTPSQLDRGFGGFNLLTDIIIGARADQNSDRHFLGMISSLTIWSAALSSNDAQCMFLHDSLQVPLIPTVLEYLEARAEFDEFVSAINSATVATLLNGTGDFTVFAPISISIDVFLQMSQDPLWLDYHIVPGKIYARDLQDGVPIQTLSGDTISVSVVNDEVLLSGNVHVIESDIYAVHGVIHVIDSYLQRPQEPEPEPEPVSTPFQSSCVAGHFGLQVVINSRVYANEISWQIDTGATFSEFSDNTQIVETVCLPPGPHMMKYFDSYGDGWHDGYWEVLSENGDSIAGGPTDGLVAGAGGETSFILGGDGATTAAISRSVTVHVHTARASAAAIQWGIDGEAVYPTTPYVGSTDYFTELALSEGAHQMNTLGTFQGWSGGYWEIFDSPCAGTCDSTDFIGAVPVAGGASDGAVATFLAETEFCLGACESAVANSREDISVHIRAEEFADEIQWRIDSEPLMPLTAYGNHEDYNTAITVTSGTHNFAFFDTYGDGWHGGYYEVLYDGATILGGQSDGLVDGSGGEASFCVGSVCDGAVPQSVPLTVMIHTISYANEISWVLDSGPTFGSSPTYTENSVFEEHFTVDTGEHAIYYFDSYGDGWHGGYWEVLDGCNVSIAGGGTNGLVVGSGGESFFTLRYNATCQESSPNQVTPPPAPPVAETVLCGQTVAGSTTATGPTAFGQVGSERVYDFEASGNVAYQFQYCNLGYGSSIGIFTRDLQTRMVGCADCTSPVTSCHFVDAVLPDGQYSLVLGVTGVSFDGAYQVTMNCFGAVESDVSCGSTVTAAQGSTDHTYAFQVSQAGTYQFDACQAETTASLRIVSVTMQEVMHDVLGAGCSNGAGSRLDAYLDVGSYILVAEASFSRSVDITFNCASSGFFDGTVTCGESVSGFTLQSASAAATSSSHIYAFVMPDGVDSIIFDSCGSDFDTLLRLQSADLTAEILSCDDCGDCGTRAIMTVDRLLQNVQAGQEYALVVEGYAGAGGAYNITVQCAVAECTVRGGCGRGVCAADHCNCESGWEGAACDVETNACVGFDCGTGAVCSAASGGGHECTCSVGHRQNSISQPCNAIDCGSVAREFGIVTGSTLFGGGSLVVECNSGYLPTVGGVDAVTCGASGQYSQQLATCEVDNPCLTGTHDCSPNALCDSLGGGAHRCECNNDGSGRNLDYYGTGTTCDLCESCGPGYLTMQSCTAEANSICTPSLCSADERVLNHVCTACPTGSSSAAGENATGTDTDCSTPCLRPTSLGAGVIIGSGCVDGGGPGDPCTLACDTGYAGNRAQTGMCLSTGVYLGQRITCAPVDCGMPTIAHGTAAGSTVYGLVGTSNTGLRIGCDSGFTVSSSSLWSCGADGSWVGSSTCEPVDCGARSIAHGSLGSTNFGPVTLTCLTGYSPQNTAALRCLDTGSYNHEPDCVAVTCTRPYIPFASYAGSWEYGGGGITVSCGAGTVVAGGGDGQLVCNGDGQLSPSPSSVHCVAAPPLPPPPPPSGFMDPVIEEVGTFSFGEGVDRVDYNVFKCVLVPSSSASGQNVRNTYSIFGDSATNSLRVPAAFQVASPFGTSIGGGNPLFFPFKPEAEFDSWLSCGVDSTLPAGTPGAGTNTGSQVSSIGVPFGSWSETEGLEATDGALFWMDPELATPGRASVGLFTIPVATTSWSFQLNAQGRSISGNDWNQQRIVFRYGTGTG